MFGFLNDNSANPTSPQVRGRRAFAVLMVGIGLLILTFLGTWISQYNNGSARDSVETELEQRARLYELFNKVQQAESSQRGYLITGNEEYLKPYESVKDEIPILIRQLEHELSETEARTSVMVRIKGLTARKMGELDRVIRLKADGREAEAIAIVNQDIGELYMDSIRLEIANLKALSLTDYRESEAVAQRSEKLVLGLELLAVVILLFILYYINSVIQSLFLRTQADNEKLQQQKAILRDKNAQLERFAYIASHDLNEPLRTISSFVDLFEEEQSERLNEEGEKYLGFIQGAANRMRGLVNGMLQFARIGRSGQMVSIDVSKLAQTIEKDLSVLIEKRQAKLEYAELPVISGFRTEIRQLFQNLILNAIKYNEATPNVKISCEERTSHWEFCVKDNGIGIAPDHQERIFGMFSRLHRSDDYPGQGIGLAFCKRIVELHGGEIWLASQPGQGSQFYFTIAKDESHVSPTE